MLNNTFWWKNRPTLGPSISGTNVIETNWLFLQKEGVNQIVLRYKTGTQSYWKSQKQWSSPRNLPTMPKYGSTHPECVSQTLTIPFSPQPSDHSPLLRYLEVWSSTVFSDSRFMSNKFFHSCFIENKHLFLPITVYKKLNDICGSHKL